MAAGAVHVIVGVVGVTVVFPPPEHPATAIVTAKDTTTFSKQTFKRTVELHARLVAMEPARHHRSTGAAIINQFTKHEQARSAAPATPNAGEGPGRLNSY